MESTPKLPPHNPLAPCLKCGHTDVRTRYSDGVSPYSSVAGCGDRSCSMIRGGEHLHRQCSRCHYGWLESTLGSGGALPGLVGHKTHITRTPEADHLTLVNELGTFSLRLTPGELLLREWLSGDTADVRYSAVLDRQARSDSAKVVPLVDRPDYLEGYLDAFEEVRACTTLEVHVFSSSYGSLQIEQRLLDEGAKQAEVTEALFFALIGAMGQTIEFLEKSIVHTRGKLAAAREAGA